jgi:hypothetical protein
MDRPTRFENHRWLGDKRNQVVHDVDACSAPEVVEELMAAETFVCFGPDTLPEARNRGYRRCRECAGARAAAAAELGDEGDEGITTGTAGGPGSPAARRTAPSADPGRSACPSSPFGWPGDRVAGA